MSKRQVRNMLRLMAGGEPVELTSPMASVKKLSRLAFVAQQFGYEYMDARHTGSRNNALKMLIVPDPNPQARARAAQNWAQYPNAHDGVSLPPLVPDALELLKARIQFDLTGKNAEKRMGYAALGITVACGIAGYRAGGEALDFVVAGIVWLIFMAIFGIGLLVTRKRNAKFARRLQAAGFMPMTDETGRVRYLPPGLQMPGQANPFAGGPYGAGQPPMGAPGAPATPAHAPYGQPGQPGQPGQHVPGPYAAQPQYQPQPQPYGYPQQPPASGPYAAPQQPPAPGPYAAPQQPYPPQQPPQPYPPQRPYPQQNPNWQSPQR
ncbi:MULTISPECIES: hypothetical protein [unclassified Streptomyces]|uniref:hypothetical protein n=1 Tax=unclassified Streptomyces TaxID=2593676 RepID=UPI002253C6B8|nr:MULTISPECIES: hypothetical protein [unclassified Streptomyces]MCX5056715.1 hypothetical protein [Streptomyces sp. NBC_00452]MCX5287817.1 hypothetical protein [Streptomyces sp. NBC_00183]